MKKRAIAIILVGLLCLTGIVFAEVSENYDLSWNVIGGGGGAMDSVGYAMISTVGQITGLSGSSSYQLGAGYWYGISAVTEATTYNISLTAGWNLISVPLNLTTWALGEEAVVVNPLNVTPKNSLTSIYRYNTTSGLFAKCDHFDDWGWSPATGSANFTNLEPGRGYWVTAKSDCNLIFTGNAPSDLEIRLDTDWNLIGWYSAEEALLGEESVVGDPLNVTPENSLTSIYRYNATTGLFDKCDYFDDWGWWHATGSESFTELEPGSGYWVKAMNACEWWHVI